jgi:hypothetical protein
MNIALAVFSPFLPEFALDERKCRLPDAGCHEIVAFFDSPGVR